jgi:hypothetical protein
LRRPTEEAYGRGPQRRPMEEAHGGKKMEIYIGTKRVLGQDHMTLSFFDMTLLRY